MVTTSRSITIEAATEAHAQSIVDYIINMDIPEFYPGASISVDEHREKWFHGMRVAREAFAEVNNRFNEEELDFDGNRTTVDDVERAREQLEDYEERFFEAMGL